MQDVAAQRSGLVMGAYYPDVATVRQKLPATIRMAVAVVSANGRGVQVVRLKRDIVNSSDWHGWELLVVGARKLYGEGNVTIITNVPAADQSRFSDEIVERIRVNTVNHLV